MSWKTVNLGDLCSVITKGTTPSNIGASFTDKGIKYIRSEMLTSAKYVTGDFLYISKETHEKLKRSQLNTGDILFSMAGVYLGKTAILRAEDIPSNTNQAVALIRIDPNKCNNEYVYYYLNIPDVVKTANTVQSQSAQPNINLKQIGQLKIQLPDLDTQRRIASILSAYDDLIENNQKQIKLLEEAAQRLYKEWFVDLHFPGWEKTKIVDGVPEGWKKEKLEDVITYEIGGGWGEEEKTSDSENEAFVIRGTDFYGLTHGELLSIPFRYHKASNLSSRKLQHGDIIFEVSGGSKTEGVARTALITQSMLDNWNNSVMCASFCKLVRTDIMYSQFMFNHFIYLRQSGKTSEYDKKSASSIVNYRWKDFLSQELVLLPSNSILDKYNALAESAYSKIVACSLQIEKAKQARDRLLPKLMSGEVEVK